MKEIVIRPLSNWILIDYEEIWRYRELLYIFSWRDIKMRYKQTLLGVLWVIFQPLVNAGVFTIFFGKLANIQSGELPYSLFVFSGLVIWSFFSNTLSKISESMVSEQNLIKKTYFPKILLPLSIILTNCVDLGLNVVILILAIFAFGYIPKISILVLLPLAVLIASVTALGLGLILTSLNVKFRDVRYILPFFIQLLLFLSPVIYPITIVGERNKFILALNPITSAVDIVRFSFAKNSQFFPDLLIISILSSIVILFTGLWYFRRTEQFFADIV
jgi:lipopolysaccharide transport system permease protein